MASGGTLVQFRLYIEDVEIYGSRLAVLSDKEGRLVAISGRGPATAVRKPTQGFRQTPAQATATPRFTSAQVQ